MAPALPRLLVVDDEADIRETVELLVGVKLPGVEVVTAASGMDALQKLQAGRFDAVLTDFRMPGMDGAELVERLRASHPGLPTALFTAYVDSDFMRRMHDRHPGLKVIAKPLEIEGFTATLRELLGLRKA